MINTKAAIPKYKDFTITATVIVAKQNKKLRSTDTFIITGIPVNKKYKDTNMANNNTRALNHTSGNKAQIPAPNIGETTKVESTIQLRKPAWEPYTRSIQ